MSLRKSDLTRILFTLIIESSFFFFSVVLIRPSDLFSIWNYVSHRQLVGDQPCRKAATYTGKRREETRTGINTSSGIRTHEPSVWAGEDTETQSEATKVPSCSLPNPITIMSFHAGN
jgi:hypothetical protein